MRRSRVNPISLKRLAELEGRKTTREIVLSRTDLCEAGIAGVCSRIPSDVHEILTRARGGSITDPNNCLALCRPCHSYVTTHPLWASNTGFVLHSWDDETAAEEARQRRLAFRENRGIIDTDGSKEAN